MAFIFGQIVSMMDRRTINRMTQELDKTNDKIKFSAQNMKQVFEFDEKIQAMVIKQVKEQMAWRDQEKLALILQLRELRQAINLMRENFTATVDLLADENERLHEQIQLLEHRLQLVEERSSPPTKQTEETDSVNKSSSTVILDALLNNLYKQTASIVEDTSVNLSSLFEHLSASVSDIVDNRHEYVEESKRKLNDLADSPTAKHVHKTIRRNVENLSSSIRKAKSTYAQWVRSRAHHREQARTESINEQEQKPTIHPWRWTFQRGNDRERMRHHQINSQSSSSEEEQQEQQQKCHSRCHHYGPFDFGLNQLCTMKKWMEKLFFRP